MQRFIILLLVIVTAGCASHTGNNVSGNNVSGDNVSGNSASDISSLDNSAPDISSLNNSVSKPTISTKPPSYLGSFPLGSVSKDELTRNLGAPDNTIEMGDTMYFAYELGEGEEKRQYVYEISDGIVTDVKYHDQGPLNGSSAKKMQGNK